MLEQLAALLELGGAASLPKDDGMAFSDDLGAAVTALEEARQALADSDAALTMLNTAHANASSAKLAAQEKRDQAVAALKAVADQA